MVTGEGALAGLYILLSDVSGIALDEQDISLEEIEMQLILWIIEHFNLSERQVNQFISRYKQLIIEYLNTETSIDTEVLVRFINDLCMTFRIEPTIELIERLVDFGDMFAGSNAAADSNTLDELEKIFDVHDQNWLEVYPSINVSPTQHDIDRYPRPNDLEDKAKYHPIIPAMFKKFDEYQREEQSWEFTDLFGHTFIVESMRPDFSKEELKALNVLRILIIMKTSLLEDERKIHPISQEVIDPGLPLAQLWY